MRGLLLLLWLWSAATVMAGAWEPHARIRDVAVAAVGGRVPPEDVLVDPALRVVPCVRPLAAAVAGPRSVEVRCPDSPGWRVFVPLRLREESSVVVLARSVRAGTPLRAEDLAVQARDVAAVAGTPFAEPAPLVGRVPRRGLPAGAVLTEQALANEILLRRGDPVVLVSRLGGIEVRAEGRAMGNATAGGTVSVENLASRRIVRGRATAKGEVDVLY
ncbi:flagellar basal body P-ring formation chaperone FlgA [Aerolutibacter ruishenii]|uniref:Flagella basal body P-ring formation protein FlgA n=1 Tax=Aerolutibacter ruishenii TaxID=686800 RepID=A0A562LN32_9GAMM|nr:flagellar basal body P-ring formation chaperone FlgA [Lysobacter ruishenii]TWI09040.1 flagella basal body P-ring formation protein FlgA [Lysobacter ruishenii]